MTIKTNGGIFGRNPSFNDVTAESLTVPIEGDKVQLSGEDIYTSRNMLFYDQSVSENATFSKTYNFTIESACKVMVMYGSRDSAGTRLYTEGFVVNAANVTQYFETVSGDKTSANTGTISVTANGDTTFTIAKTAGSTSASGRIVICIFHKYLREA